MKVSLLRYRRHMPTNASNQMQATKQSKSSKQISRQANQLGVKLAHLGQITICILYTLCFRILYGYVVHKTLITQIPSRKA